MQPETLLEQCRAGDALAWEALVRRYQGRVFALAYHYLRDREEARDVAQETFIKVYRGLRRFDGEGSFTAWIVRVARNCAIDRLRKRQGSPAWDGEEVDEGRSPGDLGAGQACRNAGFYARCRSRSRWRH